MRWLLAAALGFAALTAGTSAAVRYPDLRSATATHGHIVVVFSLGEDLEGPARLQVATRPARAVGGGFVRANVRLQERLASPVAMSGPVHRRTRGALPPGTYYVALSGNVEDPTADCFPIRSHCAERWSRTVRVVVPPRSGA